MLQGPLPAELVQPGVGEMPKLDSKANPAAALLLMDSPPPGANSDVLGAVNMTLLHRCARRSTIELQLRAQHPLEHPRRCAVFFATPQQ